MMKRREILARLANENRNILHPIIEDPKKCGHYCQLFSPEKCCACHDRREEKEAYPVYVDGGGMASTTRYAFYCPRCRDAHEQGIFPPPMDVVYPPGFHKQQAFFKSAKAELEAFGV